jgi:arginyl-tRNA synthetase
MLIEMIKFENLKLENLDISQLEELYKRSKEKFDNDEIFKKNAQIRVVKLQSGDSESLLFWKRICEQSQKEYQSIYKELNISLEDRGESFYNEMLKDVVDEFDQHQLLQTSENATVVFVPEMKTPLMLKKSDGGYTYDTTDLAALKQRIFTEKADWLIYVVDKGQQLRLTFHINLLDFDLIFKAGKLINWVQESHRIDHIAFGVVLGEDGKKFKTRSGEVVKLKDLLEESKRKAYETLKGREKQFDRKEQEFRNDASVVAISAIKYADLKNNLTNNYTFSFNRMLDYRGNTAVYLIYAYARICSILRKSNLNIETFEVDIQHESEKNLVIHILKFPEVIEIVLFNLNIHLLCEYVYELSLMFTSFHRDCKVLGSEHEMSRLKICHVTKITMKKCFDLLGMETLEKL